MKREGAKKAGVKLLRRFQPRQLEKKRAQPSDARITKACMFSALPKARFPWRPSEPTSRCSAVSVISWAFHRPAFFRLPS